MKVLYIIRKTLLYGNCAAGLAVFSILIANDTMPILGIIWGISSIVSVFIDFSEM